MLWYKRLFTSFYLWHYRDLHRCMHVSHRLKLWCWREWIYDSQCARHNRSCYSCEVTHSWLQEPWNRQKQAAGVSK